MIDIFEKVFTYSSLLLVLISFALFISYKNKNLWPSILSFLYYLSVLVVSLCLSGLVDSFIEVSQYTKVIQSGMLTFAFSYYAIVISFYVKELNDKKTRTLLRLPLIGLLIGLSISESYFLWTYCLLEIFLFLVTLNKFQQAMYIHRIQLRSLIVLIPILFVHEIHPLLISIHLFLALIVRHQAMNAYIVKSKFMKYDEKQ